MSSLSEFRYSGRLSVTVAIGPSWWTVTFGPADTRDLALVVPPGRRGHRRGGWSLRSVVGDAATVTVTGATTRTLTAELTDPDTTLILRANRRGQLGLRVYRGGAEVEHVRAITRIDVSR